MTWQLFSPDLPFLQEMTIKQVHHGFWDNLQPYLPLAAAIITGTLSTIGILVTCNLAKKARDISEEQKKIAECKLQLDSFDKRFYVFDSYREFYAELISKDYDNDKQIFESFTQFHSTHLQSHFLFPKEDSDAFDNVWNDLDKLSSFRGKNKKINIDTYSKDDYIEYRDSFFKNYEKLRGIFENYAPVFLRENLNHITTTSRASRPEPQPAAPEQAQ